MKLLYNPLSTRIDLGYDASGPTYHFDASQPTYIDGLGRLKLAGETVTKPDNTTVLQVSGHQYDRRSQLTTSQMLVGGSNVYYESYSYDKTGNLDKVTDLDAMPNVDTTYGYYGDVLDDYDGSAIGFDLNGQTTNTATASSVDWNWDGMIRSAQSGLDTVTLKYNPLDQRVWREHDNSSTVSKKRYVTATINGLSQILLELDGDDPNKVEKAYVYADDQVLIQYDGDPNFYDTSTYWYVHDRLGSVRMIMDQDKNIEHRYTYKPFGESISAQSESAVNAPENSFMFTGQYYDKELEQYYLRARQYDPKLARFLSFDPDRGDYKEPLSLHRYLYAWNSPINYIDPTGHFGIVSGLVAAIDTYNTGLSLIVASGMETDERAKEFLFRAGTIVVMATSVAYAAGLLEPGNPRGFDSVSPDEMLQITKRWNKGSYPTLLANWTEHARKHGGGVDMLKYVRKSMNFNKKRAKKIGPREDGTTLWRRDNGEFLIENSDGQIVNYGVGD